MVSVNEAKALIFKNLKLLTPENKLISKAAGHTLAEDVYARTDIPAFPQSSMDGYAIKYKDKDQELVIT